MTVDMPVAAVTILGQSGTLYATQQTTPKLPGEPVCTTTHKYNFGTVNGDVTIGLPYGTWSFSIATGGWWPTESTISVSNVTIVTGGVIDTAANVVTLDPGWRRDLATARATRADRRPRARNQHV